MGIAGGLARDGGSEGTWFVHVRAVARAAIPSSTSATARLEKLLGSSRRPQWLQ